MARQSEDRTVAWLALATVLILFAYSSCREALELRALWNLGQPARKE